MQIPQPSPDWPTDASSFVSGSEPQVGWSGQSDVGNGRAAERGSAAWQAELDSPLAGPHPTEGRSAQGRKRVRDARPSGEQQNVASSTDPPSPNASRKKRRRHNQPRATASQSKSQTAEQRTGSSRRNEGGHAEEDQESQRSGNEGVAGRRHGEDGADKGAEGRIPEGSPHPPQQTAIERATQALGPIGSLVAQLKPNAPRVDPYRGGEDLQEALDKWNAQETASAGLVQALHDRELAPDSTVDFRSRARIGTGRIDWMDPNTVYCQGIVNNRALNKSNIENIYNSIKHQGLQAEMHHLVVVIRREDVPDDVDWTMLPKLSFLTRTYVGIVAGSHRIVIIFKMVEDIDKLLSVAKKYLAILQEAAEEADLDRLATKDLRTTLDDLKGHIRRLTNQRKALLDWPVDIYDWETLFSNNPEAKALRDQLSRNIVLAQKAEESPERFAQLYRLYGMQRKGESQSLKRGDEKVLWASLPWRNFLGRLAQFPAFRLELKGKMASYSDLAKHAHWPGAALHCLVHGLEGIELLFSAPETTPQVETIQSDAYWKSLLDEKLVRKFDEAFLKHSGKLLQTGEFVEWRRNHRDQYWDEMAEIVTKHLESVAKKASASPGVEFIRMLKTTIEPRIKMLNKSRVLPLYCKEMRQRVFHWFQTHGSAFYAVADLADPNWMTFSTNNDKFRYGDAGSHIVQCMRSRVDEQSVATGDEAKKKRRVEGHIINALFDSAWLELSAWLAGSLKSDPATGEMKKEAASEGLPPMDPIAEKTVKATLGRLRRLTGTSGAATQNTAYFDLVQEVTRKQREKQPTLPPNMVGAVGHWWYRWVDCRIVDVHRDWTAQLGDVQIKRMVGSYHRTTTGVEFMREIGNQSSFQNILVRFRDTPCHIERSEALCGWWALDLTEAQVENLQRVELETDAIMVGDLQAACWTAYDAFERKAPSKARAESPLPGAVATADETNATDKTAMHEATHAPDETDAQEEIEVQDRNDAPRPAATPGVRQATSQAVGFDPFCIGASVPDTSFFFGYANMYWLDPGKWPSYGDWASIERAIKGWEQHDVRAFEWAISGECDPYKVGLLGEQLKSSWHDIILWAVRQVSECEKPGLSRVPFPGVERCLHVGISIRWLVRAATNTPNGRFAPPHLLECAKAWALFGVRPDCRALNVTEDSIQRLAYAFRENPEAIRPDPDGWFVWALTFLTSWNYLQARPTTECITSIVSDLIKVMGSPQGTYVASGVHKKLIADWERYKQWLEPAPDSLCGAPSQEGSARVVGHRENVGESDATENEGEQMVEADRSFKMGGNMGDGAESGTNKGPKEGRRQVKRTNLVRGPEDEEEESAEGETDGEGSTGEDTKERHKTPQRSGMRKGESDVEESSEEDTDDHAQELGLKNARTTKAQEIDGESSDEETSTDDDETDNDESAEGITVNPPVRRRSDDRTCKAGRKPEDSSAEESDNDSKSGSKDDSEYEPELGWNNGRRSKGGQRTDDGEASSDEDESMSEPDERSSKAARSPQRCARSSRLDSEDQSELRPPASQKARGSGIGVAEHFSSLDLQDERPRSDGQRPPIMNLRGPDIIDIPMDYEMSPRNRKKAAGSQSEARSGSSILDMSEAVKPRGLFNRRGERSGAALMDVDRTTDEVLVAETPESPPGRFPSGMLPFQRVPIADVLSRTISVAGQQHSRYD
ncbi:hypothetical protein FRB90_000238 [Tulasnella sp. 427]|nr:hypothetical protein FRB90_000238 [Tulasnella sp. 427]